MKRTAVIIGGGIGGLAAALALRQAGFDTAVYERSPEIKEVGSGISLWSNALAALDRLGVLPPVRALGVRDLHGAFRRPDGRAMLELRTEEVHRDAPTDAILMLHRAELLNILLEAFGRERVQTGATCVSITHNHESATARFADGREATGDLIVGADGLRSVVRSQLFGDEPPRYGGYTTWRAIVPLGDFTRLTPGETWGRGRRFGHWGMSGQRVYWYATLTAPEGQSEPPGGRKARLKNLFRGWHDPIEELIDATDEEAILHHDVYDRRPLSRWSVGRVTLLGDACHPMTPDLGQGGCQAIEDAVILSDKLRQTNDVTAALKEYEAARIPRTSRIVKESRTASWVAQWQNPIACRVRRFLLGMKFVQRRHFEQLKWLLASQV